MNRRTFIQRCLAVAGGVYAAFVPTAKKKLPVIVANGQDKVQKWSTIKQVHDFGEPIKEMFEYKDRLIIVTENSAWACSMTEDEDFNAVKIEEFGKRIGYRTIS